MLTAEIIAIGSELLTPERSDTNSLWLTEKLNEIGIEVKLKTVVGDDQPRLEEAIGDALKRSDLVITTGGLGPTEDDITRQSAANAVGIPLVYHNDLEVHLRERFKRWGREMPEINKRQAFVIEGAEVLPNPNGSAVGMMMEIGAKMLALFPGPPREMHPMFLEHVFPRLEERADGILVRRRVLKVSGMGESAVDEVIAPIYRSYTDVETSILFNRIEIEVHISTKGRSAEDCDARLAKLAGEISNALGTAVFATNGEMMEEVIGEMLRTRNKTLSTAESCTGGLIGMRLTEVPGSSNFFMEGAITYSNGSKVRTLGVDPAILEEFGAVSEQTAEAMAAGMRQRTGTDYAISVTGIAGPDGGSREKPVGTVWIGLSTERRTSSRKFRLPGDRELVRWRSSQAALDLLRRAILREEGNNGSAG